MLIRHAAHLDQIGQAMSIKYNNRVYELKAKGVDVIVMSLGEAFFDIPLHRFDDLPFPSIYHYAHSRGVPELRNRLASYYTHQYGVPVDPDTELMVTAGCKLALQMAFMAILNPGDEVIIYEPAWVTYPEQVRLCHGVPVMVPYNKTSEDIGKYVTSRTKAIVLNNPHNPRGRVYPHGEIEFLSRLALQRGLYLISDETYSDFLDGEEPFVSAGRFDPRKEHTIICNSMSKSYGISGWRIGHIITNASLMGQLVKVNQHILTCPATILQYYLARHFDDLLAVTKPQIQDVLKRRRVILSYMESQGLKALPGTATFYFFVSLEGSKLGSEAFCDRLLEEERVCVVPGVGYGPSCDGFVRVSVGTESIERMELGLRKIRNLIRRTS